MAKEEKRVEEDLRTVVERRERSIVALLCEFEEMERYATNSDMNQSASEASPKLGSYDKTAADLQPFSDP